MTVFKEYIVRVDRFVPDAIYERAFEEVVRCRDCRHSRKEGTLCVFFASWEPIAGGDEYAEIPADVEPDGFCAWGVRKDDA